MAARVRDSCNQFRDMLQLRIQDIVVYRGTHEFGQLASIKVLLGELMLTLTPACLSLDSTSVAAIPAIEKVTMPHLRLPISCTVTPLCSACIDLNFCASRVTSAAIASMPISSA